MSWRTSPRSTCGTSGTPSGAGSSAASRCRIQKHPESILYNFLTSPRNLTPRWYMEGSAVFFETWMAGGLGRAQGAYDEMVFRAKVRDGDAHLLAARAGKRRHVVDFQVGANSYLYGTRFFSYLALTYGPETDGRMAPPVGGFARPSTPASSGTCSASRSTRRGTTGSPSSASSRRRISRRSAKYPLTEVRHLSPRGLGSMSRGFVDEQDQQPDRRLPLPRPHRLRRHGWTSPPAS